MIANRLYRCLVISKNYFFKFHKSFTGFNPSCKKNFAVWKTRKCVLFFCRFLSDCEQLITIFHCVFLLALYTLCWKLVGSSILKVNFNSKIFCWVLYQKVSKVFDSFSDVLIISSKCWIWMRFEQLTNHLLQLIKYQHFQTKCERIFNLILTIE